jgi:hypothetical protein
MRYFIFIAFLFLSSTLCAQQKVAINEALKKELDSLYKKDQELRGVVMCLQLHVCDDGLSRDSILKSSGRDSVSTIIEFWRQQNTIDSINTIRAIEIIKQYGYPGKSMVGEPTNEVVFFIFQHARDTVLKKYFPYIKKAAEEKELRFDLAAMMEDRMLMNDGLPQIYGTQIAERYIRDSTTGKDERFFYFWPIADEAHVNERRQKAGFKMTIEEYGKRLDVPYDPKKKNPFIRLLKKQ